MKGWLYFSAFILFLSFMSCKGSDSEVTIEVQPVDYVSNNVPVHGSIDMPDKFKNVPVDHIVVELNSMDDVHRNIPGQIILDKQGQYQLWWILPETQEAHPGIWEAVFHHKDENVSSQFAWQDSPGKHLDLINHGKKIFRYEYEVDSQFIKGETLTARNKVFYHIYDLSGENLITNGYEEGVWSHHRGIMIGWRDVGYKGQELSFWGMEDLTVQKHIKFIEKIAGPVVSEVKSLIRWNDSTGNTVIEEVRTATIFNQPDPDILILDFDSELKAVNGAVSLDGDPEHAGVQYRASNDVAAEKPGSKKPTYYFHQENIDPTSDYDLPWVGMTYGLNDKTYNVVEMAGEDNPKPAIWSAYRDYGRFGPYISKKLANGESLKVDFRFWISESPMPAREKVAAKYNAYLEPPGVIMQ